MEAIDWPNTYELRLNLDGGASWTLVKKYPESIIQEAEMIMKGVEIIPWREDLFGRDD